MSKSIRYLRIWCGLLALALTAGYAVTNSAQALPRSAPAVVIHDIRPQVKATYVDSHGLIHQQLVAPVKVNPFALVGASWLDTPNVTMKLYVRIFTDGGWSAPRELLINRDHDVDDQERQSQKVRAGTDPLQVNSSTGIELWSVGHSRIVPKDFVLSLINSSVTPHDRAQARQLRSGTPPQFPTSVTSPQGAVVKRPTIVTRAEWGADESWRSPNPRLGSTIIAGFIHHTAMTSDYTQAEAPAQVRNLYAYFIKTRKFSDIAYNYVVDRFGTIYEGRSGCPLKKIATCDGPSAPVIGGHTAGMNDNTFGIAVMGNFDVSPLDSDAATVLTTSLAQLIAWRIAPYGLNPTSLVRLLSTDASGKSRYKNGELSNPTPVISAHRDVGRTVCPGRYVYPLMPAIRTAAAEILRPVVRNFTVTPNVVNVQSNQSVTMSVIVPADSVWTVGVQDDSNGTLVANGGGQQGATGPVEFVWDLTDSDGNKVHSGRYSITVTASVNDELLGIKSGGVVVDAPPKRVAGLVAKKVMARQYRITWEPNTSEFVPVTRYAVRVSANQGGVWGPWRLVTGASSFTASGWQRRKSYWVQVTATNALGTSPPTLLRYWTP